MGLLFLIIILLLLFGAFPAWPHARNWGYGPSGVLGVLLVILLVMLLLGAIPWGWNTVVSVLTLFSFLLGARYVEVY